MEKLHAEITGKFPLNEKKFEEKIIGGRCRPPIIFYFSVNYKLNCVFSKYSFINERNFSPSAPSTIR